MIRSLYTATSGMRVQQHKLDSIGNNIANASTIGYKRSRPNFKETLYDAIRSGSGERDANLRAGNGVLVDSIQTYFNQGSLGPTNNKLDVAIDGPGFFRKRSPSGQDLYTRNGNFRIGYLPDGNARLEDSRGYPILNELGEDILLPGYIEDEDLLIAQDGRILIENQAQDGYLNYGRLGIYDFMDRDSLMRSEGGDFMTTDESSQPMASTDAKIYQGYLEHSNVEMATEMTNLIIAQRAYQLNSRVVQTSDEMEKQANSLRG